MLFPEGELEAEWLQDVGLSTLISGNEEEDGKALLSTLTRTQAAAVKKRYNTYTQTLRKKNKQPVRDVRDVFGVSESPVCSKVDSKGVCFDLRVGGCGRDGETSQMRLVHPNSQREPEPRAGLHPIDQSLGNQSSLPWLHLPAHQGCAPFSVEVTL